MILSYLFTEIRLMFRFKLRLVLSILLPLSFYILFTSIMHVPNVEAEKFNKMYMYSMATFSLTSFCLISFPLEIIDERQRGWYKCVIHTPLRPIDYFGVKIYKAMIQFAIAIIVIFGTAAMYNNVEMTLSQWLVSGVILWVSASLFLTLGLLLAQINDIQKVSSLGNLLYLALAILGGLWFPIEMFPSFMQQLGHITPTYHLKKVAYDIGQSGNFAVGSFIVLFAYSIIFLYIALYIRKKRDVT